MPSTPRDQLLASLEAHNTQLTKLLSLIPSQYYIAQTPEEADSRWMKNKKRKTGEEIKEHKRRAKATKLDPENNKTTDQILFADQASSSTDPKANGAQDTEGTNAPSTGTTLITPLPPASSISSLKAKIAAKLAGFQRRRGDYATGANGVEVSNLRDGKNGGAVGVDGELNSRDALEAEQRARRGELRDKRRQKNKETRKKEGKEHAKGQEGKQAKSGGNAKDVTAKPNKTQLLVPQLPVDNISYQATSLPSSHHSGAHSGPGGSSSKTTKAPLKALSNPTQALAHLQKHQTHLAKLPEEKRMEIEEANRWAKAEARASGDKVADDEKVLKKAVKRLEKTKSKSGKEWSERKKDLQKKQSTAIKKRSDNIAARAEARKNKRLGIKDKTKTKTGGKPGGPSKYKGGDNSGGGGKGRPGFEGKKGKKAGSKPSKGH